MNTIRSEKHIEYPLGIRDKGSHVKKFPGEKGAQLAASNGNIALGALN